MITLETYMNTVNYRITEGGEYGWSCYGDHAHQLSAWNGTHGAGGWSANIIFDTTHQTVYEVDICDYTRDRAYRIINPDFVQANKEEAGRRGLDFDRAWDEVNYIDLEVDEDWLEKARAIIAGKDYDTRVSMPVDFSDEDLFRYMKLAHERDITLNQLIEQALREAIDQHNFDKD